MTLRWWFYKILAFQGIPRDMFVDENGDFVFFDYEVVLIKALLVEMQHPHLKHIVSHQQSKRGAAEELVEAKAFREIMLKRMVDITDDDVRATWVELIDILSQYE